MVKLVNALNLSASDNFDFLKEEGWGDPQVSETKDYKLGTFHTDFHCGLGHCEVPFYFNSSIDIFDKLEFKTSSDVPLKNIYVKRVLEENNETNLPAFTLILQNNTYYYKLYFDYEPEWTKGIIKRVKDVKFNISTYLGLKKILEIDPIAHQSVAGGSTTYIDDDGIDWEHTITCNDDLVLIVGVATDSDVQDKITSIVYNDKALTKLVSIQSSDSQVVGDYWNLSDPDCGAAYWVNVTGDAHEDAAGVSTVYAFVDYIKNSSMVTDQSAGSSSATIGVTTANSTEIVVDMFALDVDPDATPSGDNQVERHEVDENDVQMSTSDGWDSDGTVDMTWGGGFNDEWVLIGAPLIPAPDVNAPTWTLNTSNASDSYPFVNDYVKTEINWSDKYALNYTWFSSNFSGTWVNGTPVEIGGNLSYKLITKTQATAGGKTVCWTSYANDSSSNVNQSSLDCFTVYKYGGLNVSISYPANDTNISQYGNFSVNATITCVGGVGAKCGTVKGYARYNLSSSPDTGINATEDEVPFYITGGGSADTGTVAYWRPWNWTASGDAGIPQNAIDKRYNDTSSSVTLAADSGSGGVINYTYNLSTSITSGTLFVTGDEAATATAECYLYNYTKEGLNLVVEFDGTTTTYAIDIDTNGGFINSSSGVVKLNCEANAVGGDDSFLYDTHITTSGNTYDYWGITAPSNTHNATLYTGSGDSCDTSWCNDGAEFTTEEYGKINQSDDNRVAPTGAVIRKAFHFKIDEDVSSISSIALQYEVYFPGTDEKRLYIWNSTSWDLLTDYFPWGMDNDLGYYGILNDSISNYIDSDNYLHLKANASDIIFSAMYTDYIKVNVITSAGAENPQTSPTLDNGENWNVSWVVNATGATSTQYLLDVFFNSSYLNANVEDNNTDDRRICIGTCPTGEVAEDSCDCPQSYSTDWEIDLSDYCETTSTCISGDITFINDGDWNVSALVNTTALNTTTLDINDVIYIESAGTININPDYS